jgi:FAD/FMN-containing dehydrogenase
MTSTDEGTEPLNAVLESFTQRVDEADHFAFSWLPHTETARTRSHRRLPADARRRPVPVVARLVRDEILGGAIGATAGVVGRLVPVAAPRGNRVATALTARRTFADHSATVFTAAGTVGSRATPRFCAMEYAIAREHAPAAVRRIRALIAERGWRLSFPVEVRTAAADENWLSTAYGRDVAYIGVRCSRRDSAGEYFRAVEEIMRDYDGRPHWGLLHNRVDDELRQLYPRFGDFLAVRDRMDPHRLFGNPYLQRVLGG